MTPRFNARLFTGRLLTALAAVCLAGSALAQDYPNRPLRMVVPYPAGGIADRIAREASEELGKRLKQPVVVENRNGAAGNIGFDYVARQPADGYTLLLAPASNLTVQPALFKNLSYDLAKDFTPVSVLLQTPLVNSNLPVQSARELIDYSKQNPGKVNFGVTLGSFPHLTGELLKTETGADFNAIPYQGLAPAMNDLLSGQTQFAFADVTIALPQVQGGKLRPLAVASPKRVPWLPNVPTMAEAGFPGFEVASWYAVVARSGTPPAIVERISRELSAIVQAPDFRKRYSDIGAFTVGGTPEAMGAFTRTETSKWTAVVKHAGIEPN
jgi:tripartite-type tricarboxylate transporter receptor subunit TctC